MFQTCTGNFPIGVRRGGGAWQKDLPGFINWLQSNGFSVVDLGRDARPDIPAVVEAGLRIGSVDLLEWQPMLGSDAAKRNASLAKNAQYIADCSAHGVQNFFCVMLPEDPAKPRLENFGYAVEALNGLAPALEKSGAKLVIEGYPGAGAQCCTPETYRAAFRQAPSMSLGINYDPSHLLRMGIDPIRFLKEFAPRIFHVHGKDALLLNDDLYEYGWEQPATFKPNPAFGASAWRYTIPGQGNTPWAEVFRVLSENGYGGAVSIELEDENYNGSDDGEQRGFLSSAQFLSDC